MNKKTEFPLYGFTFMRGVERFDYPYLEMLENLTTLTDKVCVALGPAEDNTEKNVRAMSDLEIVDSPWDEALVGDGGKIFSYQANVALKKLRELYGDDDDAWAFFLHCDEIIHPDDYERVYEDIKKARETGCDAVSFRFLHFWDDHYHIAISKRWHPSEIRALKLASPIECWGDAQGFKNEKKLYESDVCIYHYGHVRDAEKRDQKQREILRRIRPAEKFSKYYKRERKAFDKTHKLTLLVRHPQFMKERMERLGDPFDFSPREQVYIVGEKSDYSERVLEKINAKKVHFASSLGEVPSSERSAAIIMSPTWLQKIFRPSRVPLKMESPRARNWNHDQYLMLKLFEKGISVKTSF